MQTTTRRLESKRGDVCSATNRTRFLVGAIGLIALAAIVALAILYQRWTSGYYAQLCCSLDRIGLATLIDHTYHSKRWAFTRLLTLSVFGGLCAFFLVKRAIADGRRGKWFVDPGFLARAAWLAMFVITVYPDPLSWTAPRQQVVGTLMVTAIGYGLWAVIRRFRGATTNAIEWLRHLIYETKIQTLLLGVFLAALVMSGLASSLLFERVPHVQDSIDQLFQAKILLEGRLYAPSPEPRTSFDFLHMINNGKWYSQYPVGHSLLLALGLLANAPWLVNPLVGALCCILLYPLGKEMFDDRTGRLSMLLAVISPFVIFMSSEYMNHAPTLLCWELGMLGYVRMLKYKGIPDAILSGAGFGYGLLIRPLTMVSMALPLVLFAIVSLARAARTKQIGSILKVCLTSVCVAGAFLGVSLLYNQLTNGSPWLSGYEVCWGKGHLPGFGHAAWGPPHTPELGWIQILANLNDLNLFLLGWPVPAFFLVSLTMAFGKKQVWDYLLVLSVVGLCLGYFTYWYQDFCFGPRQLFESSAALLILVARFFRQLSEICSSLVSRVDRSLVDGCAFSMVCLCAVFAIYGHVIPLVTIYSHDYWGTDTKTVRAIKRLGIHNAVVFMKSNFGSVFIENSPSLDSDVIYARDCGDGMRAKLARSFPSRLLYVADGGLVEPYHLPALVTDSVRRRSRMPKPTGSCIRQASR